MNNIILISVIMMALLGLVLAVIIFIVSRLFHVQSDPLVDEIEDLLPKANCGACGFPGCRGFAELIVKTKDPDLLCPVANSEAVANIAKKLGMAISEKTPTKAALYCQGTSDVAVESSVYTGVRDCRVVLSLYQGPKGCPYGCLGFGTCKRACPFDAIKIENGIAVIDDAKCTGCTKCVAACPLSLLKMKPYDKPVFVACNSHDKGGVKRKYCKVACIGCQKCVKTCPEGAITMDNFVARVDFDKCTLCMQCVEACPTNAIKPGKSKKAEKPGTASTAEKGAV